MSQSRVRTLFSLTIPFCLHSTTQSEPAYCGISTLVLVLNAFAVDPQRTWKGPWRWYEERMLNCCIDLEDIKTTGITMREFQCLAHCQGLSVDLHYADDYHPSDAAADDTSSPTTTREAQLQKFRQAIQLTCVDQDLENDCNDDCNRDDSQELSLENALVVSYDRKILGQTGSGHFSPLAAYDPISDSVLILDLARFKYGPHWVPVPLMFDAMCTKDPATGKSRGYLLMSFTPPPPPAINNKADQQDDKVSATTSTLQQQPLSRLFRSKRNQNSHRRMYKDYLNSLGPNVEVTWEQVVSYWTKGAKDPLYIWSILEPQRIPVSDEEGSQTLLDLKTCLDQIRDQFPLDVEIDSERCKDNNGSCGRSGSLCMNPEDAIFVVYLASLPINLRRELVMEKASDHISDFTKEELLMEADLISKAIEVSDEM